MPWSIAHHYLERQIPAIGALHNPSLTIQLEHDGVGLDKRRLLHGRQLKRGPQPPQRFSHGHAAALRGGHARSWRDQLGLPSNRQRAAASPHAHAAALRGGQAPCWSAHLDSRAKQGWPPCRTVPNHAAARHGRYPPQQRQQQQQLLGKCSTKPTHLSEVRPCLYQAASSACDRLMPADAASAVAAAPLPAAAAAAACPRGCRVALLLPPLAAQEASPREVAATREGGRQRTQAAMQGRGNLGMCTHTPHARSLHSHWPWCAV